MTVEFYRIETHDCTKDASGNPVSNIASDFNYIDGNNCGLICSTQDGPTSPMRGGSADNIYVVPAPHTLTFGAATLLAAACCVHAVLCLVSMWDRVLEINWRRRFGRQEEEDNTSEEEDANKGVMKTVNDTIGFFLRILAVPVFGGAGLAILIVGEINFFSPQVEYQTEPMANIGELFLGKCTIRRLILSRAMGSSYRYRNGYDRVIVSSTSPTCRRSRRSLHTTQMQLSSLSYQ
jgi:hypothetical protein